MRLSDGRIVALFFFEASRFDYLDESELGTVYQVSHRLSLSSVHLRVQQALKECAFEMNERGILRVHGWVRFEPFESFEQSSS